MLSVTYASAPSADLLIPTLEFNNETAGVIRLIFQHNFHEYVLIDYPLFVTHHVIEVSSLMHHQQFCSLLNPH